MKTRERTYKEHEDAPSGQVYFYNYKEPLMPFKEGFGFRGALIHDEKSDQIQCHFCGGWFDILGHHLHKEHNMNVAEYKKQVGLNTKTSLISETHRALLISKGLEKRLKNLRPNKGHTKESRLKISATLRENRAEMQNIHNTCPEQLLERLTALYNKLGRTPRFHGTRVVDGVYIRGEVPFGEALIRVYGSIENACKMAGIPYRKPGSTINNQFAGVRNREKAVNFIREFYETNQRIPTAREIPRAIKDSVKNWGSHKKKIFADALSQDGIFKKIDFVVHYDKETLIDFLRIFEKKNGRYPSGSDCRRGLLPTQGRYIYHFKSWHKALRVAFPDYVKPSLRAPRVPRTRVKGLNALERMSLRLEDHKQKLATTSK